MSKKTYAVYRETPDGAPKAIDVTGSSADTVDRIVGRGRNWYGAFASSPDEAIQEFRRYEASHSVERANTSKRTYAVYRETPDSDPRAIDITGSSADNVDRIVGRGRNWYGASADSPDEAIQEFRRHEVIKSIKKSIPGLRRPPGSEFT